MRNRLWMMLLLLAGTATGEENLKFGQPACGGRLLDKTFFVICHSPENKVPVWVGYALTREDLAREVAERKNNFRADRDVPSGERAELSDYRSSGFDRGHMAPAADFKRSEEAMSTTFLLTNMCPQKHGLNAGRWSQLEAAARELARSHGKVWIFSGPVFAAGAPSRSIGTNHVAIPTHFYKVVLCVHSDDSKEMFAYVMPNLDRPRGELSEFAFSTGFVEKLTGLDFFAALPADEQKRLESAVQTLPVQ